MSLFSSTLTGAIAKSSPTQSDISAEIELLLCCARMSISSEKLERIEKLIQSGIDWQYLLQIAHTHGVLPLVCRTLNQTVAAQVPKEVLQQLKFGFESNAIRNLCLTNELFKLLELFESHNIPALPFKGAATASMVYGDISLRSFCDIDVLVHQQDYLRAKDLLLSQGYQPLWKFWFLKKAEEDGRLQADGECSLACPTGQAVVDLHSRLMAGAKLFFFPLSANFDHFWESVTPVQIGGRTLHTFQPEDQLLYLCMHGSKSLWTKLIWVCDIAELVCTYPDIKWGKLLEDSQKLGVKTILMVGLYLSRELFEIPLPDVINQKLKDNATNKFAIEQVYRKLIVSDARPLGRFNLMRLIFYFSVMDRLRDKVALSLSLMTSGIVDPIWKFIKPTLKDYNFFPLPESLYSFYYLIRPVRLIGEIKYLIRSSGAR